MKSASTIRTPNRTQRKRPRQTPTIAVIGLGYVGLPLALRAATLGYPVIGFDIDITLIAELKNHQAPPFLDEEDRAAVAKHTMDVHTDANALKDASVIIVCVPTPVLASHEPDLRPLISATETIAPHIKKNTLVIVESTVNPGVCDEILLPIITKTTGLEPEKDFYFAYCPERINPGDTTWNVRTIPRVLGGAGPKSTRRARTLYEHLIEAPIHEMQSLKEAEAVKVTENSFRDINIAFVNELAMSFKKLGIDIVNVLDGAATKPFGFMPHYPGCGVGGHCIPVDPYYLIAYAKQNGFTHKFLETARDINNHMPEYTIDLLEKSLKDKKKKLAGSRIALLGLAYKRDVPDLRESPALVIEQELTRRGALVRTFDPFVLSHTNTYALEDALEKADAALIATDHTLFRSLTPKEFTKYNIDIVIDGRNCLDKKRFERSAIIYQGIGR